MDGTATALALAASLGCGLVGGIFFAFSNFVMAALGSLPGAQGAEAMRAINRTVLNPLFLGTLLGTVALSLAAAAMARAGAAQAAALAGAVLYGVGCVGVTILANVPLNNRLAAAAGKPQGTAVWSSYLRQWTRWNSVRTVASLAASTLLAVSAAL